MECKDIVITCSRIISDCLSNQERMCVIPTSDINVIRNSYRKAVYDNPMLFNSNQYNIYYEHTRTIFEPEYAMTPERYVFLREQCTTIGNKLYRMIESTDEYTFLLNLHHEIMRKISYFKYEHANSIVGPLMDKTAVCEGISKLIKFMCNLRGIKCELITGEVRGTNEPHMWVQVKLGNNWYNMDATFDLTSAPYFKKIFDFFLISDDKLSKSHYNYTSDHVCDSDLYDYYISNGLVMVNRDALRKKLLNDRIMRDYVLSFQVNTESDNDMTGKIESIIKDVMHRKQTSYSYELWKNPLYQIYHIYIKINRRPFKIRNLLSKI